MQFPFEAIQESFTYEAYRALGIQLFEAGKTTSDDPAYNTAEILEYTKVNMARMKRLDVQTVVLPFLAEALAAVERPQRWVLISESWCGDAAQIVPVLAKVAAHSPAIGLEVILRDKNLPIMDLFLTNGGRSIPKLIAVDAVTNEVLGHWGPRPANIQEQFLAWKAEGLEFAVFSQLLHAWYANDKTVSIQEELATAVKTWSLTAAVARV